MKRFATIVAAFLVVMSIGAAFAAAPGENKVPCSVCGYLTDKGEVISTQFEGKTYYFCDAGCKAYFDRDPKAFAAGTDFDAVCGMTVDKSKAIKAVHNNRQIYFCSAGCKERYFASPGDYEMNYDVVANTVKPVKEMKHTATYAGMPFYFVSAENKAAFEKNPDAYLYAMCPVTGKTFLRKDAGATMAHGGKTYYFCCPGCQKKFAADPKKYVGGAAAGKYESCGAGKTSAGCDEAKQSAEGCQKAIESGQCPHMKQKSTKSDAKKTTEGAAKK